MEIVYIFVTQVLAIVCFCCLPLNFPTDMQNGEAQVLSLWVLVLKSVKNEIRELNDFKQRCGSLL